MKCPYCDTSGGFAAIHRHLVDAHGERVAMTHDQASGKMEYAVTCPVCALACRSTVNPRGRNTRFLDEFQTEIALVAFDQLIYHLIQEHPAALGVDPADLDE